MPETAVTAFTILFATDDLPGMRLPARLGAG